MVSSDMEVILYPQNLTNSYEIICQRNFGNLEFQAMNSTELVQLCESLILKCCYICELFISVFVNVISFLQ